MQQSVTVIDFDPGKGSRNAARLDYWPFESRLAVVFHGIGTPLRG